MGGKTVGVIANDCMVNGGSLAERLATIRHGASAMSAIYNASISIYTVIVRRAFGVAGSIFTDPKDGSNVRLA
ncbi:hypothetical protein V5O48_010925 [Marasmius crinis-equi]|uniref:CoA carboxyltransferase C-terminal domain-containing protein n=1 Tax=Marasmius crinis-equi TaxID=585013 RepID=A0ABR3F7I3_9AGAR